jgi:glycosyltransferase involved in cell wall biosynthesis
MGPDGAGPGTPGVPLLSVVLPVYNERTTIREILQRVQAVELDKEIIVVDDGSSDGTTDFLRSLAVAAAARRSLLPAGRGAPLRTDNVRVLLQERNAGKGAALRRGFAAARGRIVLVQDADLEYDPADYPALLRPIITGQADVVYGTRFSGGRPAGGFFWYYLGNRFITALINAITGLRLSDAWVCLKAFRRPVLESLTLVEDRFGFELEVTLKIAGAGWRFCQVPVSYRGRSYAEGKKITWRDGLTGLLVIARHAPANGRAARRRAPDY